MDKTTPKWLQKIFGVAPWKKQWQKELTDVLQEAQRGLNANMVVIVARESDIYSEVLFIFSFLGLSIGALLAYFSHHFLHTFEEALLLPLAGFSAGATCYTFRRYFVNRIAPRAVKDRVTQKAKAQFFDHYAHLQQRLALIYISEIEREALFLASPDIEDKIPREEIQRVLNKLVTEYRITDPLKSLKPSLEKIGESMRTSALGLQSLSQKPLQAPNPLFIGASDRSPSANMPAVPVLKGNKDIN